MSRKSIVAQPEDYPKNRASGYYADAFKKDVEERSRLRNLKDEWKALIDAEWGHILPKRLLKKISNPTNYRLTS